MLGASSVSPQLEQVASELSLADLRPNWSPEDFTLTGTIIRLLTQAHSNIIAFSSDPGTDYRRRIGDMHFAELSQWLEHKWPGRKAALEQTGGAGRLLTGFVDDRIQAYLAALAEARKKADPANPWARVFYSAAKSAVANPAVGQFTTWFEQVALQMSFGGINVPAEEVQRAAEEAARTTRIANLTAHAYMERWQDQWLGPVVERAMADAGLPYARAGLSPEAMRKAREELLDDLHDDIYLSYHPQEDKKHIIQPGHIATRAGWAMRRLAQERFDDVLAEHSQALWSRGLHSRGGYTNRDQLESWLADPGQFLRQRYLTAVRDHLFDLIQEHLEKKGILPSSSQWSATDSSRRTQLVASIQRGINNLSEADLEAALAHPKRVVKQIEKGVRATGDSLEAATHWLEKGQYGELPAPPQADFSRPALQAPTERRSPVVHVGAVRDLSETLASMSVGSLVVLAVYFDGVGQVVKLRASGGGRTIVMTGRDLAGLRSELWKPGTPLPPRLPGQEIIVLEQRIPAGSSAESIGQHLAYPLTSSRWQRRDIINYGRAFPINDRPLPNWGNWMPVDSGKWDLIEETSGVQGRGIMARWDSTTGRYEIESGGMSTGDKPPELPATPAPPVAFSSQIPNALRDDLRALLEELPSSMPVYVDVTRDNVTAGIEHTSSKSRVIVRLPLALVQREAQLRKQSPPHQISLTDPPDPAFRPACAELHRAITARRQKFLSENLLDHPLLQSLGNTLQEKLISYRDGLLASIPWHLHALAEIINTAADILNGANLISLAGYSTALATFGNSAPKREIVSLGMPQQVYAAKLLRLHGRTLPAYIGAGAFEEEEAIIPFLGQIYKPDGMPLSPQEMSEAGLEWIGTPSQDDAVVPVLAPSNMTARKLTVFSRPFWIKVIAEEDGLIPLITLEDYERFITQRYGAEPLAKARAEASAAFDADAAGVTDTYNPDIRRQGEKVLYFDALRRFLTAQGHRLALPVVAIQYKGVGAPYRWQAFKEDNPAIVASPEIFRGGHPLHSGVTFRQQEVFAGKTGVMLAEYYEGHGNPVNGASQEEVQAFRNDRLLLKNGAQLSTLTLGAVPLLDEDHLQRIRGDQILKPLYVSQRLVLDDTRSLEDIIKSESTYREFLTREVDPNLDWARDKYLQILGESLGHNLAACLRSRLGIEFDDVGTDSNNGYTRNISPWGLLRDNGDLAPFLIPEDAIVTIKAFLDSALVAANLGGVGARQWFQGAYFDSFIRTYLDQLPGKESRTSEWTERLEDLRTRAVRMPTDHAAYQTVPGLARLLFEEWLRGSGLPISRAREIGFRARLAPWSSLNALATGELPPDRRPAAVRSSAIRWHPSEELHGGLFLDHHPADEVGVPASADVRPEDLRLIGDAELEQIAAQLRSVGLGFLLSGPIGYTRTRISADSVHTLYPAMATGHRVARGTGYSIEMNVLIPDFPSSDLPRAFEKISLPATEVRSLKKHIGANPSLVMEHDRREVVDHLISELKKLGRWRAWPKADQGLLKEEMYGAVLHEVGESIFIALQQKSEAGDARARGFIARWMDHGKDLIEGDESSLIGLRNLQRALVDPEDSFLPNVFADKFAMFVDPESFWFRLGEGLTEEESASMRQIAEYLGEEHAAHGDAFYSAKPLPSTEISSPPAAPAEARLRRAA